MNQRPIDQARNADLRGSWQALQRAARRARELAVQTGTDLIVSRDGVIERVKPVTPHGVNEASLPYKNPS